MSNKSKPPGAFIPNLIHFVRLLRWNGISVGTSQVLAWIEALEWVDWRDPEIFYQTAESTLINRESDRLTFRRAFVAFWWRQDFSSEAAGRIQGQDTPDRGKPDGSSHQVASIQTGEGIQTKTAEALTAQTAAYSPLEILRQKDFSRLSEEEIKDVRALIVNFDLNLSSYQTRRFERGKGNRLDLRESLHSNIRYGGEWLRWVMRRRRFSQRPLIILADISGSMERYSRLLLLFIHALSRGYQPGVEAFLFGTQLSRITPALKYKEGNRALEEIAEMAPDWSGGTRIGHSLRAFNMKWGRRVLSRRPIVLIISDGWDRGDPSLLRTQMDRLQRSAAHLIWVNPLLGSPNYQAKTRGMLAALPYVDNFLPAHNLESLQALADLLQELSISTQNPGYRFHELSSRRIAA